MARAPVEKLANFVAERAGSQTPYYYPSLSQAVVALSLALYDSQTGSAAPNLQLTVRSQPTVLLDELFNNASSAVAQASARWEELASPPAPLMFRASGTGAPHLVSGSRRCPAARIAGRG